MENQTRYYVIEHMEEFLFDWTLCEYIQIMRYLSNLENVKLIFSNLDTCYLYKGEHSQKNNENLQQLEKANDKIFQNKAIFLKQNLASYQQTVDNKILFNFDDVLIAHEKACLLDMRAKSELTPQDKNEFHIFIIGGILGDHPPRDRTIKLREKNFQLRHLGVQQMSTDTALLVTKLVLENNLKLEQIPFFDEPTVSGINQDGNYTEIQMNGFKYVSDALDPMTGQIVREGKNPIIEKTIQEVYMLQDLDFSLM